MSKRKGRRQPQTSEIKSVLRPPPEGEAGLEGEDETEAAESDAGGDAEALEHEDELNRLDAKAIDETVSEEPAAGFDGASLAPDPEPTEIAASAEGRPRRLRAVRARDEQVTRTGDNVQGDAEVGAGAPDSDTAAVARWGDDGGPASDADHERLDAVAASVDSVADGGDDDGDESVAPAFTFDGAEGDDTEGFLRGLVEALLFTSQKPLDLKDLARSAGIDKPRARELLEQLQRNYEGHGLCIEEVAGGFVMRSSPRYAPYIQKILAMRPVRLSRAQLETLAIVAYRQPVTKPEVDDIRGVDSGQVIKGLLERALLKMLGKKDEPGRPTLYGTTNDFLELLNLQSLKDLPTLREYTELSEESQRKFLEETGEAAPSEAMSFERPPARAADESGAPAESAGADERSEEGPLGSIDDAAAPPTPLRGDGEEEPTAPHDEAVALSEPLADDQESTEPLAEDDDDEKPKEPHDEDGDELDLASANGEALNGSDSDYEVSESSDLETEAPETGSDEDESDDDDDDDDDSTDDDVEDDDDSTDDDVEDDDDSTDDDVEDDDDSTDDDVEDDDDDDDESEDDEESKEDAEK